jgi:hypothetical protein
MFKAKLTLTRISSFINAIWYLEIIGCIIFIGLFLTSACVRSQIVVLLPVDFSELNIMPIKSISSSFESARLDSYSGILFFHVKSSLGNVLAMTLIYMLIAFVILAITYQVRIIFANFRNNQHFTKININRLKVISLTITLIPFVQFLFALIANFVVKNNFKLGPYLELSPSFNYGFLITGIFLFSTIAILKLGRDLEEENKLTV